MHNSLHIRDLLRRTNADPLYTQRRDPHRGVARDPAAKAGADEMELAGSWQVTCDAPSDVSPLVVTDAQDFLARIGINPIGNGGVIEFAVVDDLMPRDCRTLVEASRVRVEAGGIAGLWAGAAWLEMDMRTRRGPFLPLGERVRSAAWEEQISQGPWGGNYSVPDFSPEYLSDDSLRLYAHYGVNSMMIYGDLLCYADGDALPELRHPDAADHLAILKSAAERADRYGVRFHYVVVGPKLRHDHPLFQRVPEVRGTGMTLASGTRVHVLCSSHELVQRFYDQTFEKLFREVPQLAGVNMIVAGESMYHCKMWRLGAHGGADRIHICPVCQPKPTHVVITDLVTRVERAIHRAQPAAYAAVWAYTVNGWDDSDRETLFNLLPKNVAAFHHIEKDQWIKKDGYTKHIWDYSIDFQGPSDDMIQIAKQAHAMGRPLFIKTETGTGLETFQYPYVPAMQRFAEKWENVRAQRPRGVHQSWLFFGMFGSRAEALGLWAAYEPDVPSEEFLRRLAVRDFGAAAAGDVLESWRLTSEAMGHLPLIQCPNYYVGPIFLGPCHPLLPTRETEVPPVFHGHLFYLQELEESFSVKQISEARASLVMTHLPAIEWMLKPDHGRDAWDLVTAEYGRATRLCRGAWEALRKASAKVKTDTDKMHLQEETLLTELIYRTNRACENTIRFLIARDRQGSRDDMNTIASDERANAAEAVHIFAEAPWLDIKARTDGSYSACGDMLAAKIKMLDEFLK